MHIQWELPSGVARQLAPPALLLLAAGALYWWLSAPSETGSIKTSAAIVAADQSSAGFVLVDVTGEVRRPGVVRLRAGARVFDAVAAAGGLRPGHAAGVNLARVLVDGEQVSVGGASNAAIGGSAAGSAPGGKLNINSATVAELDELPGIGAVLAQRILDYRTQHGAFTKLRDLLNVPGIGDAKYADIASAISVA